MADIVISGDVSGAVTLTAPAVAGTTTLTLPTTSGTLVVTGGAQTVQFAAGSAASPSITFTGDTNTGIFSPAADTIALSEGGTEVMRITSGGYTKMSNSGNYGNVSGSYHELYNDANTETVVIRNANASFNQEAVVINVDRNTTNNSYYFLRANVPGVGTRLLIADSGAIGTAGSISLGSVTPPTSGIGIQFPATQSASSNANTLDDYEEGTWTPSIGGTATYFAQDGAYVKIGRLVIASFDLNVNSRGTGSQADISGLPFAAGSGGIPAGMAGACSYWANTSQSIYWIAFRVDPNSTTISNAVTTSGQTTASANSSIITTSTRLIGTIVYFSA